MLTVYYPHKSAGTTQNTHSANLSWHSQNLQCPGVVGGGVIPANQHYIIYIWDRLTCSGHTPTEVGTVYVALQEETGRRHTSHNISVPAQYDQHIYGLQYNLCNRHDGKQIKIFNAGIYIRVFKCMGTRPLLAPRLFPQK